MMLPGVVLAGKVGGLDTAHSTHIATPLRIEITFHQICLLCDIWDGTYSPGRRLTESYVWQLM